MSETPRFADPAPAAAPGEDSRIDHGDHGDRDSAMRAARAAAKALCAGQQIPDACLLMVATPIGNLADVGLRTLAMLQRCDLVAAEDTRAAQRLLQAWGLSLPLLRADRHREQEAAQQVLAQLREGRRVAFVSDAGTPGIRDPGAVLARSARAAGYAVLALPGPSAVTTALSASGIDLEAGYVFAGYIPATEGRRRDFLAEALGHARTVVCFETPHRIESTVEWLQRLAPQRKLLLAKELSKQFETYVDGDAAALLQWLRTDPRHAQGEFVLLIGADAEVAGADLPLQARRWALRLAREMPASRACALAAEMSGAPRRELYRWLLLQPAGHGRADDASQ